MPYSDRKKSPDVHSGDKKGKTTEYENCKNCGRLIPFGSRCDACGLTSEEWERRWENYKRE